MLRATQDNEIPAGNLTRIRAEDSDRTRMLKDVMKSVAKYATGGMGKMPNESAQAAGQLIMKAAQEEEDEIKRLQLQKGWDPCDRGFLSVEQENSINGTVSADDDLTEQEIGPEFSELLRHTGGLVKGFSSSLSSISGPLGERPPHIGTTPIDICLISRKEAEDIVAGGATDHKRREQAAWSWVQENVKFKELDKVSRHIDESGVVKDKNGVASSSNTGYEDLRKHFDQHHQYHPVLTFLTDHTLVDDHMWIDAVHKAMYPPVVETEAAPRAQPGYFAPKALSRTPKGASSRQNLHAGAQPKKAANRISFAQPGGGAGLLGSSAGSSGKGPKKSGSSPALR